MEIVFKSLDNFFLPNKVIKTKIVSPEHYPIGCHEDRFCCTFLSKLLKNLKLLLECRRQNIKDFIRGKQAIIRF